MIVRITGRNKGADPKWLLPMLCRRGGITRQDVGPIRIFERETKVLISDQAARDFARAVGDIEVQGVRIVPILDPNVVAKPGRQRAPDRKRKDKAAFKKKKPDRNGRSVAR